MRFIKLAIFFASIDCISLASIVFVNSSDIKEKSLKMILIASVFWLCLFLEVFCLFLAGRNKGNIRQSNHLFFSNDEAKFIDFCMIFTLVVFIAFRIFGVFDRTVILTTFAFLYLTVNLHFLLNSKTYNRCKVSK